MEKQLELLEELFSCSINLVRKLIFYVGFGKFELCCNEKNMPPQLDLKPCESLCHAKHGPTEQWFEIYVLKQ